MRRLLLAGAAALALAAAPALVHAQSTGGGGGGSISGSTPLPTYGSVPSGATVETGSCNTTTTGACPLFAAAGAGVKNYLTGLYCSNTSSSSPTITLSDTSSAQFIVPQTFGNNINFPLGTPLNTAANTALTFTASAGVSTLYCTGVGFKL